ncbi:hypothetical protein M9H77_30492 [Catharanthus roseus]|uniref:Uncharacterized protein n=1 Tax=Catharanthus roseus TaxID=4058 RepID=A0ACB9ZXD7_CATRO|nr:hypothetical protein M9H77_30492 [Catharanthus roseus]
MGAISHPYFHGPSPISLATLLVKRGRFSEFCKRTTIINWATKSESIHNIQQLWILMGREEKGVDSPAKEDRLQDCSAGGFLPVKKITRSGIGASSSQLVEDDDEAKASDDEEDKVGTQNTIPMDAFQIEMRTAFEQLQINQEVQGMQLTEIVEFTRRSVDG